MADEEERLRESKASARAPVDFPSPNPLPTDFLRARAAVPMEQSSAGRASIMAAPEKLTQTPPAAAPIDPALMRKLQNAFRARQRSVTQKLPLARLRRTARWLAAVVLALIVSCGVGFRTQLVLQFPALAGAYQAIGLGVNLVGLDFRDVKTIQTLRKGVEVLAVDATLRSASDRAVSVPAVIVTLLSASGAAIYQWSVMPKAADLRPGEVIPLETELSAPPPGAARVRLSFANGHAQQEVSVDMPMPKAAETH
jgi:hypothetical protein